MMEKLPEGWKRVRLREVSKRIKTIAPQNSFPYVEIGDIDVNKKTYSKTTYVVC